MNEREQVIANLQFMKHDYLEGSDVDKTLDRAIELLKAQEPVEPMLKRDGWNKYNNDYVCPVCDQELVYEQNYCSECGRAVKWDGWQGEYQRNH